MRALLADGPLAERQIMVPEALPTLHVGADGEARGVGRIATHRYRLADVDFVRAAAFYGLERVAVYVHAPPRAGGAFADAA